MAQKSKNEILLVEDDQYIREALSELLEDEGFDVIVASNGQEGIDRLIGADPKPRLILLDLMMPVKDGFQFREEQLNNPAIAEIPVIVMSADGNVTRKLDQIKGSAYLKKPVDVNDVISTIQGLL